MEAVDLEDDGGGDVVQGAERGVDAVGATGEQGSDLACGNVELALLGPDEDRDLDAVLCGAAFEAHAPGVAGEHDRG